MVGLGAVSVLLGMLLYVHKYHINAQCHVTIHMEGIKLGCKTDSFALC
jgi:hypothetical protein